MSKLPGLPDILLERRKSAVIATLNRPKAKNALNAAVIEGLFTLCDWLEKNRDVRALALRGAGGTFCAGGDIREFSAQLTAPAPKPGVDDPVARGNRRFGDLLLRLDALPQAFITVIEGAAFGGALGFIAVSDIAVADARARFSLSETTLGLPPAQIGPFVVRRIGLHHARRLALTGARFDAEEAARIGLVSRVTQIGLEAALAETLSAVGRCEPDANAATKRIFNAAAAPVDPALLDKAAEEFAACLRGRGRDGAMAFAAKKQPDWVEDYWERLEA